MFSIIDELTYPEFCAKHNLKPLSLEEHGAFEEWARTPHDDRPYTKAELPFLDFIHWLYDLGDEWMASEERARLVKGKNMGVTKAAERTRSKRWRAGTKRQKPKHNWPKRYRTNFR